MAEDSTQKVPEGTFGFPVVEAAVQQTFDTEAAAVQWIQSNVSQADWANYQVYASEDGNFVPVKLKCT